MLKEREQFLSGQEICEKFNVSRTAVWKIIKLLESEGYEIEAVRKKGYRLKRAADKLSRMELLSSMQTEWAGTEVLYFDETDSTNTEIKKAAEQNAPHGTLAVADYQSMGKGRRGRIWTSPHGVGIWMSILLRPKLHPSCASMLTLVAALAVADGLRESCKLDARIKWPNDIVVNGKKVCGILTEMSTELDCINYVVVGIGINANTITFPEELQPLATSIRLETGACVSRSLVIREVLRALERVYALFLEHGDLSGLLESYHERLANKNQVVRVLEPEHAYTGISEGINARGELLVRMEDGSLRTVISGEVSVRGIYGYV